MCDILESDAKLSPFYADFVVVGLGAAGCVMVNKLLESGHTVIAVEAGSDYSSDPNVLIPLNYVQLPQFDYAKYYFQGKSVPDYAAANQQFDFTTGRLLGGSTSINGMQATWGTPHLYDEWEALVGAPFTTANILSTIRQIERYTGQSQNPAVRGRNGLMNIRQPLATGIATVASDFANAVQALNLANVVIDYNDPNSPINAFTQWQLYQYPFLPNNRDSASNSFLQPNPKLTVLLRTTALKILTLPSTDGPVRATGILAVKDGIELAIFARRNVIVTAGLNSSGLLQVSGLGPTSVLTNANVPIVVANDNIGANLVSHPLVISYVITPPYAPSTDIQSIYTGGAFLPDPRVGSDPTVRAFEFTLLYVPNVIGTTPVPETTPIVANIINQIKQQLASNSALAPGFGIVLFLMFRLNPLSRGSITIQNADPLTIPFVDIGYLNNSDDIDFFVAGFKNYLLPIVTQMGTTTPGYFIESPPVADIVNPDTTNLVAFIKANVSNTYHYSGSNRMAPQSSGGAVNNSGIVYGTSNLVVADDSIMPFIVDGHLEMPALVIAWIISQELIANAPIFTVVVSDQFGTPLNQIYRNPCPSNPLVLSVSVTPVPSSITIQWLFDNCLLSVNPTFTINPSDPKGTYKLIVTVDAQPYTYIFYKCSSTLSTLLTVVSP